MRWTDGERGPSFKKSEINRHLPKIEVRHMRKASDPKAPSPLPSFVVRTYQLGSLEFLPLSSTLSAADARRRRPFAHLLKVSWVLSGSSWSTKMDSVRVSNTLIRENYSLVYFTNIFPVSTHLSKPQKHYSIATTNRFRDLNRNLRGSIFSTRNRNRFWIYLDFLKTSHTRKDLP